MRNSATDSLQLHCLGAERFVMTLRFEQYVDQLASWPASGRHILAQFDEQSIVVYQAYRPAIGHYAAKHGEFGGDFSFSRMTWIKPSFLWMMFRSGWGAKVGQEVTLAIRILRNGFDTILSEAVPSSFDPDSYASREAWRSAVQASSVRLQWDPDHDPSGGPLERRAIQLGIRGETLTRFVTEWIESIEDISNFVATQRKQPRETLILPQERVYPVPVGLGRRLGIPEASPTERGLIEGGP
jgi:hypothetical protein